MSHGAETQFELVKDKGALTNSQTITHGLVHVSFVTGMRKKTYTLQETTCSDNGTRTPDYGGKRKLRKHRRMTFGSDYCQQSNDKISQTVVRNNAAFKVVFHKMKTMHFCPEY